MKKLGVGGRCTEEGFHLLKEYRRMKNGKLKLVRVRKVKDAERVSFDQLVENTLKFRTRQEIADSARNEAQFEDLVDMACER